MKSSTIQIVITGAFIFFAVLAVIIFSKFGGDSTQSGDESVVMWGVIPAEIVNQMALTFNQKTPGTFNFEYKYKSIDNLEKDLTDALLSGEGIPDAVIIPHTDLIENEKKLTLISWTAVSERDIKDSYVEGGEIFFADGGTYAIPFLIDPLVMYWNRDIFNSQAIARPPEKWEEVIELSRKLTEKEENQKIKRSAVSLGEFGNIPYAKEILSTLFLQAGSNLIKRNGTDLLNVLSQKTSDDKSASAGTALSFFTQFSNPEKDVYTWSRSLPSATSLFVSSDLAMYFGFGSEVNDLRAKNPNLNFDITTMPQAKSGEKKIVFGKIYGFAIVNQSKYKQAALNLAIKLTSTDVQRALTQNTGFAPVKRNVIATLPGTGIDDVLWKSALWTHGWLDPSPEKTTLFFKDMIESVTSGKLDVTNAIETFSNQLTELIR